MANQLIRYAGGVVPSDSQATPGAVVERDNQGDTYAKGVNASTYLATGGGLYLMGKSYTANATLDATTVVAKGNATGGAFTLTLPPASASADLCYFVIKTDSSGNAVTVKGNGSESINGGNTYALGAQYNTARLWCDGTQWWLL